MIHRRARTGITLLEIVLALAIAAIAMTLLSQLVGIGNRSAAVARDSARAQMIAESLMAEVMAGIAAPQSGQANYEQDPAWSYNLMVSPGPSANINVIQITVTQAAEEITNPISFTLTQWQAIPPEPLEEETTEDDTTGSGV